MKKDEYVEAAEFAIEVKSKDNPQVAKEVAEKVAEDLEPFKESEATIRIESEVQDDIHDPMERSNCNSTTSQYLPSPKQIRSLNPEDLQEVNEDVSITKVPPTKFIFPPKSSSEDSNEDSTKRKSSKHPIKKFGCRPEKLLRRFLRLKPKKLKSSNSTRNLNNEDEVKCQYFSNRKFGLSSITDLLPPKFEEQNQVK